MVELDLSGTYLKSISHSISESIVSVLAKLSEYYIFENHRRESHKLHNRKHVPGRRWVHPTKPDRLALDRQGLQRRQNQRDLLAIFDRCILGDFEQR